MASQDATSAWSRLNKHYSTPNRSEETCTDCFRVFIARKPDANVKFQCPDCAQGGARLAKLLLQLPSPGMPCLGHDIDEMIRYWHCGVVGDYVANVWVNKRVRAGSRFVVFTDNTFSRFEPISIRIADAPELDYPVELNVDDGQVSLLLDGDRESFALDYKHIWLAEEEVAKKQSKENGIPTSTYRTLGIVRANGKIEVGNGRLITNIHERISMLLQQAFIDNEAILTAGRIIRQMMLEQRFVSTRKTSAYTAFTASFDWTGRESDLRIVEQLERDLLLRRDRNSNENNHMQALHTNDTTETPKKSSQTSSASKGETNADASDKLSAVDDATPQSIKDHPDYDKEKQRCVDLKNRGDSWPELAKNPYVKFKRDAVIEYAKGTGQWPLTKAKPGRPSQD